MTSFPTLRWWNLSQCFTQVDEGLERSPWPIDAGSAARPIFWDADGTSPTITLTHRRPSATAVRLGLAPVQSFLDPPLPDAESWLTSSEGKAVVDAARATGGVRLQPAIWTRQAQMLCELLRREGLAAEAETNCPHGRIFHWNTRVGMRELFLSIPSLAPHLLPSLICHDAHQLAVTTARLGGRAMLVKSNFALGGVGISVMMDGRRASSSGSVFLGKKKGAFSWAIRDEPMLVEQFVGDAETNVSLTVDARKTAAGLEIAGVSQQLLVQGFLYDGIVCAPATIQGDQATSLRHIAEALADALARRGYHGWFNFDCVVTADRRTMLVDLNVRRSAPLDAHMIVNRLVRSVGVIGAYRFDELEVAGCRDEEDIETALYRAGLAFDGRAGVITLSAPHVSATTVPFLTVATDMSELEENAHGLRRAFA